MQRYCSNKARILIKTHFGQEKANGMKIKNRQVCLLVKCTGSDVTVSKILSH